MSFHEFVHQALPGRVVFGAGRRASVPEEVDRLGLERVFVLSTRGHADIAEEIAQKLGRRVAAFHPQAVMHVPAAVAADATRRAREVNADGLLAIGGGSAIGLGKAVAKETALPSVAVPTTYAGSEMTPIWGLTDEGHKRTGRDPAVLPRTVVYDPELTLTLPGELSAASGLNALAHAAEALYAPDVSPLLMQTASEAARALTSALPRVVDDPEDIGARADALTGAWLAGVCLGTTAMSLHHKLCHILGGTFNLPHAQTHANLLAYVLAFNLPAAPEAKAALSRVLGTPDPVGYIHELVARLGIAQPLRALGLPPDAAEQVSQLATGSPYANPRPASGSDIRQIIRAAYEGVPPGL